MYQEDFFNSFIEEYNSGDKKAATIFLMKELGKILVRNRKDFVDLLNESGIYATESMSDKQLIDTYISNLENNPKLALGSSLLLNMENQVQNFNGEEDSLNDDSVKAAYSTICDYFKTSNLDGEEEEDFDGDDLENVDDLDFDNDDYSNSIGAIAGAVGATAQLGTAIAQGEQKKKYGAMDALVRQKEAKAAMVQQVLAQRQAEQEAKAKELQQKEKTKRTVLVVTGIVVGLGILTAILLTMRKNKNS